MNRHLLEVEVKASPPFLRSMLYHMIADHLITQVNTLHISLVILQTSRNSYQFPVSLLVSPTHSPQVLWLMEIGEDKDSFCVHPADKRVVVLPCHNILMTLKCTILRQQLGWQLLSVATNSSTSQNEIGLQRCKQRYPSVEIVHVHLNITSTKMFG